MRRPAPDDRTGLPLCSEDECPEFDGKRCRLTGFRPERFCEPALVDMVRANEGLRRQMAAELREAARMLDPLGEES